MELIDVNCLYVMYFTISITISEYYIYRYCNKQLVGLATLL